MRDLSEIIISVNNYLLGKKLEIFWNGDNSEEGKCGYIYDSELFNYSDIPQKGIFVKLLFNERTNELVESLQIGREQYLNISVENVMAKLIAKYPALFGGLTGDQRVEMRNNIDDDILANIDNFVSRYVLLINKIKQAGGWKEYNKNILGIGDIIFDSIFFEDEPQINVEELAFTPNENEGKNVIYYGVPGCGKSYIVNEKYLKNIDEFFYERITFHPEYTYEDFVGQIMPTINKDKDRVEYKFVSGPFTRILEKALENQTKMFYIIIEEINRGNAPAIFGDIFQLLDRVEEGENKGRSQYTIDNEAIRDKLNENLTQKIQKIYIPGNLTIIATMNTSDQNVFTLDTAFKRRFGYIKIRNNIEDCNYKDYKLPTMGENVTWKNFVNSINKLMRRLNSLISNSEDKMIGAYFVRKNLLLAPNEDANNSVKSEDFAAKVMMYLWNDVFKYERDTYFKYDTLDELIYNFKDEGIAVFKNYTNIFEREN